MWALWFARHFMKNDCIQYMLYFDADKPGWDRMGLNCTPAEAEAKLLKIKRNNPNAALAVDFKKYG